MLKYMLVLLWIKIFMVDLNSVVFVFVVFICVSCVVFEGVCVLFCGVLIFLFLIDGGCDWRGVWKFFGVLGDDDVSFLSFLFSIVVLLVFGFVFVFFLFVFLGIGVGGFLRLVNLDLLNVFGMGFLEKFVFFLEVVFFVDGCVEVLEEILLIELRYCCLVVMIFFNVINVLCSL